MQDATLRHSVFRAGMQAARDGLARLHGEPQHAKQVKPDPDAGADSLHTHTQQQVLDSLVRPLEACKSDARTLEMSHHVGSVHSRPPVLLYSGSTGVSQ